MNISKEKYYNDKILSTLLENDIVTNKNVSQILGITEKSTRKKIDSLNELLRDNDLGIIEKKSRVGIWLDANERQKLDIRILISNNKSDFKVQNTKNREDEMINIIFKMKKSSPLTVANIAEKMYISVPTALSVFKNTIKWFDENDIKIYTIRNKGICIDSKEAVYRQALKQHILRNCESKYLQKELEMFFPGLDVIQIRELLLKTEEQWRLELSDYSFRELWVCLSICIYRTINKNPQPELTKDEKKEIVKHNEYSFAHSLSEKVIEKFKISIGEDEVIYLAKIILCASFVDGEMNDENNNETSILEYDNKLKLFVKEIIETMSVILNEDLTDDNILFTGLLQHIRPTIFRLRYGNIKTESSLDYVKKEYKNVYRATWSTCPLFEEYFDVQVVEIELIYIALYVQVALERNKRPLKVIFVTRLGIGHSQLLSLKIKKEIPRIKDIKIARVQDFTENDCELNDIVFTTDALAFDKDNIIQINPTMSESSVINLKVSVKKLIENIAKSEERLSIACYSMIKPELMFTHLKLKDKDQIIRFLVDKLKECGYVSKGYYKSVIVRESATSTAIGNGVAIPHGKTGFVNDSKVCICTLESPISWNGEMVDVIFLIAIKMRTTQELKYVQQFYKYFISLTDTDEKIDKLRGISSSGEMYKYLIG